MLLSDAAKSFDNQTFADAFTPATTFLGQFDAYQEMTRDGVSTQRRILSVAPTVSIPATKVISGVSGIFIVGNSHVDDFMGEEVRHKYIVHKATGLFAFGSTTQALANALSGSNYAGRLWLKDMKEVLVSSETYNLYNMYFSAAATTLARGQVLKYGTEYYRVRNVYESGAGFRVAEAAHILTGRVSTTYYQHNQENVGNYNSTTDTYTETAGVSLYTLQERWQDFYHNDNEAAGDFEPGDQVFSIRAADIAAPQQGDLIGASKEFEVITARQDGTSWNLQVRDA